MKYQLHKKEDFQVSRWMGGETREIAIWPTSANYLERNFIWRLSSATVELDESDFSRLEDYDRVLMVLEGEVVLSHEGQRVARLAELEQDRFDGAYKTRSFGKITDYNLMVR
ncbi:MAG: HutD family protein, partial [Firmicutes bacterium]|nr:HutD family protein [Bacillota bacterium]